LLRIGNEGVHEVEEELAFHFAQRVAQLESEGWDRASAETEARRRFADEAELAALYAAARERTEHMRALAHLTDFLTDVRAAARRLSRSPRFVVAFVAPLALALGAGASFYGVVDRIVNQPPPGVQHADELYRLAISTDPLKNPFEAGFLSVSWPDYEALRHYAKTLSGVAGYNIGPQSMGRGGGARRVTAMVATSTFFDVLGVKPHIGRFYSAAEDAASTTAAPCVLSYRLWHSDFGGETSVLGRVVDVGQTRCTIIGVTPKGFNGIGYSAVDVYLPLRATGENSHGDAQLWSSDGSNWIRLIARVKGGNSAATIAADATNAYRTFAGRRRDPELKGRMLAEPLLGSASVQSNPRLRMASWLTAGAIALVLLVAANLMNLLLARNLTHARETAICLALGGGRSRLFRQQVIEAMLLAGLATASALVVMRWTVPITRQLLFPTVEWADGPITGRIALIALGVSLVVGIAIALVTAWHANRSDPARLLNSGTRTTSSRAGRRARMALVGVQAALSMALMVAALGFVRSFRAASSVPLGFDTHGLIIAQLDAEAVDTSFSAQVRLYETLAARLRQTSGVESAALGYTGPWWNNRTEAVAVPGRDSLPVVPRMGEPVFDAVTPEYLSTMRLPLLAGRWFTAADVAGAPPVMVVNEALARLYWPNERSPLGRCIIVGEQSKVCREIVGVVANHRFTGTLREGEMPAYFLPLPQALEYGAPPRVFIRTRGDVDKVMPALRALVQAFAPNLPAVDVHPVDDQVDSLVASWRLGAFAFTALGVVAVVVAMLGLFSVLAFLTAERAHEFAIRQALGARARQILLPVLQQGTVAVGVGALIGIAGARLAARWLEPLMFETRLAEPLVLTLLAAGLLLFGAIAALTPARQAARNDPATVLRAQ
jgi:predicted permease